MRAITIRDVEDMKRQWADDLAECGKRHRQIKAERDALKAEEERLRANTTRFPEHMARIVAAKDEPLDARMARLIEAMAALPESLHGYQWQADDKPMFGEKYVRHVAGDNGHGMGRQWLASCPPHIDRLAAYIAAANPDTIAMILAASERKDAEIARLRGTQRACTLIKLDDLNPDNIILENARETLRAEQEGGEA